MNAWDYGFSEGVAFIEAYGDNTSVSQYRQIGKQKAEQYVKSDRQVAYYQGWLRAAGLEDRLEESKKTA